MRRQLLIVGGGGAFSSAPITGPYLPTEGHDELILTQLHCHTTGSDGLRTPAQIVAHYLGAGYGALAITDHDVVTSQPAGITTAIAGNEVSPSTQHIISLNSAYDRTSETDAQTILDAIEAAGGIAEIAHPNWTIGMSEAELEALDDNWFGMEIHNAGVVIGGGQAPGDPATSSGYAVDLWDALLTSTRLNIWGVSVDDLHWITHGEVWDQGRVKVWAGANTTADVIAALEAGRFVADASNHGVTPGYPVRTADAVSLTCSGATSMEAWASDGLRATEAGDAIAYTFVGDELYVRLVAIGEYTDAFGSALSDRYYQLDGSWSVGSGILSLASTSPARRLLVRKQVEWDFAASVDIRLNGTGAGDSAGLMVMTRLDSDYHYLIRIGGNADAAWDDHLTISRADNGLQTLRASAVLAATSSDWYTVKVDYRASDGRLRAKAWDRTDPEPDWMCSVNDLTWRNGGFGLRGAGAPDFDNLWISGLRTYYQPIPV